MPYIGVEVGVIMKGFWRFIPKFITNRMSMFSYTKKFLVILILFLVPMLTIMLWVYFDYEKKIDQGRQEVTSLQALKNLAELLQDVQYHRGLNQSYLRGFGEFEEKIKITQNSIEQRMLRVDRRVYEEQCDRIEVEDWENIKHGWKKAQLATNPEESFEIHNALTTDILLAISNIVQNTKIYLNPDPKLNRLNSAITNDLLFGTEQIGQLRAYSASLALNEQLTTDQSMLLLLRVGRVDLFMDSFEIKTANLFDDPNGNGELKDLKEMFIEKVNTFFESLEPDYVVQSDPITIFESGTNAVNVGYVFYQEATDYLINSIEDRIRNHQLIQKITVLCLLFSLLLLYLIFGAIYVSVVNTIQTIKDTTTKWIKGNLDERVELQARDELSEIGGTFNQLADSFENQLEENHKILRNLRKSIRVNKQLVTAINHLEIGVILTDPNDPDNPITFVNKGFEKLTGYTKNEVVGNNCRMLQGDETSEVAIEKIRKGIKKCEPFSVEILNYKKNGETYWNQLSVTPVYDEEGFLTNFLGLQTDITHQKEADNKIYHLAFYDKLTNLPNYNFLKSLMENEFQYGGVQEATVMLLDMGRFKYLNSSHGYAIGDLALKEIATRLNEAIDGEGVLCRESGDQFSIYLPGISSAVDIDRILLELTNCFQKPFNIEGFTFFMHVSIGISRYPLDGESFETLMQHSEEALFAAKEKDVVKVAYYMPQMNASFEKVHVLENDLRKALANNEFFLTYQPKYDLKKEKIVGMEALIRWQHPTRGLVSPMEFIPLAEKIGLIYEIGDWTLLEACRQNKRWQEAGYKDLVVSVNISAKQCNKDYLLNVIDGVLVETGLDPKFLEIELTESVLQHPEVIKPILEQLKSRGITISVDDFGTGYSSLSYLKHFPLDVLKIDRAFIRDILENEDDQILTEVMINIGHSLRLKVIAEGVETKEQLEYLKYLGCDAIQGYFISKPLTSEEFEKAFLDK